MERPGAANETTQSAPTVLLIDDEPNLRELYAAHLKTEYDVQTAEDGDVSLDLIRDEIDIVLSDRRMPNTSGDELLRRLRAHDIDTPVILISAINPTDAPDTPYQAYLTKPVTGSVLRKHVEQHTRGLPSRASD